MAKRNILISTVLVLGITTSSVQADVEDDIFKSGVNNTLKVFNHQKKLALQKKNLDNHFCYKMNPKDGEVELSDFSVIKLEALSLIAKTNPIYFENKNHKKTLCFFTSKTEEAYNANKRLIEEKFTDVKIYKPSKTQIDASDGINVMLPSLGKWNGDTSEAIALLNSKIKTLKEEAESKDKLLEASNKKSKEILDSIKNMASKIVSKSKEFPKISFKKTHKVKKVKKVSNITKQSKKTKEVSKTKTKVKKPESKKNTKILI